MCVWECSNFLEQQYLVMFVLPLFLFSGCKRKFSKEDESGCAEEDTLEEWPLRDVIFVDHVTNLNVGVVVKLDGNYVAVHYPLLDEEELSQVDISKCRLLRKDEMVVSVCEWQHRYSSTWIGIR